MSPVVGAVLGDAAFLEHEDLIWSPAMTVCGRCAITSSVRLEVSAGRACRDRLPVLRVERGGGLEQD